MATQAKSRWANDAEDAAHEAQRKREKEEKKRAKAEKLRKQEGAEHARRAQTAQPVNGAPPQPVDAPDEPKSHPAKRRKLDANSAQQDEASEQPFDLLRFPAPQWGPCRHVDNFEKLNHIEEGSYGWVSRARETATGEVVALKKLKTAGERAELPVTGLREIQTLMVLDHENVVKLREVVVGTEPYE